MSDLQTGIASGESARMAKERRGGFIMVDGPLRSTAPLRYRSVSDGRRMFRKARKVRRGMYGA